MAAPTYTPGQVLGAADCNSWFVDLAAYKSANQTIASSTVMINDTALFLAVAASATYRFEMFIFYTGNTQGSGDIQWQFAVPASCTMRYAADYLSTAGTAQIGGLYQQNSNPSAGTNGVGVGRSIRMHGSILVAATPGNVNWQWAQNTSNGTGTIVQAQSYFAARRIA